MDVKKLESSQAWSPEAHLNVGLVEPGRPFAGSQMEVLRLISQARLVQAALEFHQIERDERSGVFIYFRIVRIGLELAGLMGNDRHRRQFESSGEVSESAWVEMVEYAPVKSVAEGERGSNLVVESLIRLPAGPDRSLEVHPLDIALHAKIGVGPVGVKNMRSFCPEGIHKVSHHLRLSPELVPEGEKGE